MARLSFRDRFFTRPVARAITSPLGIVLFGAGTAVGIVTGLGLLAPLLGLGAWAARVIVAVPRDRRGPTMDAYTLGEPWRQYVMQAQSAAARFRRTVGKALDGPTKDRLTTMAARLDDALEDCWRVASRGDQLDAALATLNTAKAQAELAALKQRIRATGATSATQEMAEALHAQLDSAERLQATRQDAADRLRLLDVRFDEIVARAVEVSVGAGDTRGLDDDVTDLVTDLEALRRALEDVDRAADPSIPLTAAASAPDPVVSEPGGPESAALAPPDEARPSTAPGT